MSKVGIVILSGACCNPSMSKIDQEIESLIHNVADDLNYDLRVKILPISSIAITGLGFGKEIGNKVRKLFKKSGTAALPMVFINGELAFYSQIPGKEEIKKKFKKIL